MNKKVFVVIVTYNGAVWIDKNITSLLQSTYPVHIIVVDNNSSDNSVALLEKYPKIDVIRSDKNLGFGKANNIGIQKALQQNAGYVFLLNQDAWVFKDTVLSLVSKMENNMDFGIVSPLHFASDGANLDKSFEVYYKRKIAEINQLTVVPFVNAAAWMISRKCLEKTGFFESEFSHYGEDRNYCDRVLYHNFKIGIDKDSKICHDRIITRNFKKDVVQCRYKILATLLDINKSFALSLFLALKEVFGLPKYFSKFYSFPKTVTLFLKLLNFYLKNILSVRKLKAIRKNHKNG